MEQLKRLIEQSRNKLLPHDTPNLFYQNPEIYGQIIALANAIEDDEGNPKYAMSRWLECG